MADYINRAPDGAFLDLVDDREFQRDLVRFFSGGRYNYSKDQMREMGFEGLARQFAEHMRGQGWNEVTALKDLNYVNNKDSHRLGKEAFGNLMQAWDTSDRAGTGFGQAAADFGEAMITAPSTYASLFSLGATKLLGKASTEGTKLLVRGQLRKMANKGVSKQAAQVAAQNTAKLPSVFTQAAKGAGTGFATEAAIGGVTAGAAGETREKVIKGYQYTSRDLLQDAFLSGIFGAGLGGVGAGFGARKQQNIAKMQQQLNLNAKTAKESAVKAAKDSLNKATPEQLKLVRGKLEDLHKTLEARLGDTSATLKDDILAPLPKDKVDQGNMILAGIKGDDNFTFSSGLDVDTYRSIAAATIDMSAKLDIKPGERITSAVSRALDDGRIDVADVEKIRETYGLTREQFSLIYLADVSRAGKILAEQSKIARRLKTDAAKASAQTAQTQFQEVGLDVAKIAQANLSTFDDKALAEISSEVVKNTAANTEGGKIDKMWQGTVDFLRNTDQMRIAFMTSQLATTARNATSTGILTAVDISDEFARGLWRGAKGVVKGDFKPGLGSMTRRMSSVLRGMSYNNGQAELLRHMLREEMPESYVRTFHDTLRMEVATQSNSIFAQTGRMVNFVNTSFDTAFKEGAFFASIERQLMDIGDENLGTTVADFLKKNSTLDDLPAGVIDKAMDDANRFTMQRTYARDTSAFGTVARNASSFNRKVPFVMSSVLGMPFPRYVANHLEMMADYTPVLPTVIDQMEKNGVKFVGDKFKSSEDRFVRQLTGVALIAAGYNAAAEKHGEGKYTEVSSLDFGILDPKQKDKYYEFGSSMGFVIGAAYIGDLAYRVHNDLPVPEDWKQWVREGSVVLGGLGDLGVDTKVVDYILSSVDSGSWNPELQKWAGNVVSTMTYPGTISRDITGQYDYTAAGSPYTRDVYGEGGMFLRQATRFLPDYKWIQYTQEFTTRDRGYDLPYYTPFNPAPVGKMNPLIRSFTGVQDRPPLSPIEKEMRIMKLDEFMLYNNKTVKNSNLDYAVRYSLSQNLNPLFEEWRKEENLGNKFFNLTYDELTADNLSQISDDPAKLASDLKQDALASFIRTAIKQHERNIEKRFIELSGKSPARARGYINNAYELKVAEEGEYLFDTAAQALSQGQSSTAVEYLAEAETPMEVLERKQMLLSKVRTSFSGEDTFEIEFQGDR